jgi:RNA polymerase sigma-70 factor (ECF subfamily)
MSCDEIAAATDQQPGAVMTQLFRARQRLKDLLGGRAAAEGGRK